jgi:hypothetical protein
VVTTAKSHGVYNVLDECYVPATPKAEQLLRAQSQFLYKVFESTVKLSQGRLIIRQHEDEADGRAVWLALNATYAGGVAAELLSSKLESELVTMRLNANWNKTIQSYLTMWEHKVQDLVAVRNIAPRDIDRYTWLKATLSTHSGMANVISMFESNKGMYSLLQTMGAPGSVATRVDVPFDHFYAYLMDEAVKLDKANGDSKRNVRKGNKADHKGKPKGGNGNDSKDKSKQTLWLPPEKWAKMSKEEKQVKTQ